MKTKLAIAAMLAFAALGAHAQDTLKISELSATVYPAGANTSGYVSGTAINTSNSRIQSATIAINLLDASGAIVGTTSASAVGIEPLQQWKFRAPTSQPYERAVVAGVTAS